MLFGISLDIETEEEESDVVFTRTGQAGRTVRKKSRNFAETRKVREFDPKYWENQKKMILEN